MSETAASREVLAPFCQQPWVLDLGFGGDPVVPHAVTFDLPRPYTSVGGARQILKGDVRDLSAIADGAFDVVYSAHLLEDMSYSELASVILPGIRRVIRPGGLLVTNCPDQQRFLAHCARTSQPLNMAHVESTFSLENFKARVLSVTGPWEPVFEQDNYGAYCWLLVVRKPEE